MKKKFFFESDKVKMGYEETFLGKKITFPKSRKCVHRQNH